MRIPFIITSGVLLLLIAYVYPFIAVLRGRAVIKIIGRSYGALVLYMICLGLLIPGVVSVFDRPLSREMLNRWVPEGPGVVAVAFVGWLPASIAASWLCLPVGCCIRSGRGPSL